MLSKLLSIFQRKLRPGYGIFPLGVAFVQAREELRWDREKLARRLAIDDETLTNLEMGCPPDRELRTRMAELFTDGAKGRAYLVMVTERLPDEPMQTPQNWVHA